MATRSFSGIALNTFWALGWLLAIPLGIWALDSSPRLGDPQPIVGLGVNSAYRLKIAQGLDRIDLRGRPGTQTEVLEYTPIADDGFTFFGFEGNMPFFWSVSSGGIKPGSTLHQSIIISRYATPGVYETIAVFESRPNGGATKIPVRVTVVSD